MGIRIDNINKDNRKDICSFLPTQQQKNEVAYFIKNSFKIPDDLQTTYLWVKENNFL